jgi:hypothetical protein
MMQEILKPLLESDVLTSEVKEAITVGLTEAIKQKEEAVREQVEKTAKANFEAAKTKFEETYKTLEQSYKTKLNESKVAVEASKTEIEELVALVEELKSKPFVNVSESDMESAEAKLVEELEVKYEKAFDLDKEKFNSAFELIHESNSSLITTLESKLLEAQAEIESLTEKCSQQKKSIDVLKQKEENLDESIASAIAQTEEKMRAQADQRIETIKQNLVTSTEIFLEQELAEIKADKENIMKETQGRELLESIKVLVKQYWDVDSEVAQEILEMKKEANAKVEQYKDMLKKEHARLEEAKTEVENLKKKVIVESKGSVLTNDKKRELEKLAENIESDKLESKIDELMESVINTFNSGFSKKEVAQAMVGKEAVTQPLNESKNRVMSNISSGDKLKESKVSDELAELLSFAGVRR